MSEVKAISGATAEEMEQLTEKAKEMGAKTKFSATESAEAFKYMAMAGWKAADMMDGIEGIMDLAAASGENLGTVSDIVTDALTAMGLEAKDAGHFADVLAAAAANSNTNVSMMGETFKYAAPLAGALGYSIEDTAQAIGIMANSGIKASQAGTSMRMLLTRLASPTEKAEKYMNKYGISLTNADGSMRPLIKVLDDMRANLSGLSEEEQVAAANAIAGQNAQSGFLAILNASQKDWDKLRKAITNCDGAAKDMAETMMDNLPGAIEILSGSFETTGLTIYEKFTKPLQKAALEMADFVDEINVALENNDISGVINLIGDGIDKVNAKIAEKLPGVIEKISGVAGQVLDKLNEIAPGALTAAEAVMTSLAKGLQDNLPKLEEFAKQIGPKLLKFVAKYKVTMFTVGASILTSVISGLAANTALIRTTVSDIVTKIGLWFTLKAPQLIEDGKAIFKSVVQGIADATVSDDQKEAVNNNLTAIFDGIDTVIDNVVECLGKIVAWYTENQETITAVVAVFTDIAAQISSIVAETVLPAMLSLLGDLATWIKDNKDKLSSIVTSLGSALENGISFVNDVLTWTKEHGASVNLLLGLCAAAFAAIKVAIDPIGSAINAVIAVGALLIANWETVKSVAQDVWTSIKTWIDDAIASLREFLGLSGNSEDDPNYNPKTNLSRDGNSWGDRNGVTLRPMQGGASANHTPSTKTTPTTPKRNTTARPYASGIDYVPYDNYLAALHRGEAVVPKNEAERERSAAIDPAAIASAVADAVVSALSGMAVQMDGQQVGELVAPAVSAAIGASANRQKRYSGVFA